MITLAFIGFGIMCFYFGMFCGAWFVRREIAFRKYREEQEDIARESVEFGRLRVVK